MANYLDRRGVVNTLSSYLKSGGRVNDNEVTALCDKISTIHKLQGEVNDIIDYLGSTYNIKRELKCLNASTLQIYHERLGKLLSALGALQLDDRNMSAHIYKILAGGWNQFRELNGKLLNDYIVVYKDFSALEEFAVASVKQDGVDWLDGIAKTLKRWSKDLVNLRSKVAYNVVRKQVCDHGLSVVVEAFESGIFTHSNIVNVYRKSLYKRCANHYISQDKELSFFQSILFEDKIKRFRKLCKEFEELTRRELAVRLSAMLPALRKEASQSSDVGFLKKCIRNGCREVSIRKLFETIPDLISRMCPAMLMSPLSVSQYLGANWPQFDLVIFDEASQMPTCETVAAIS